VGAEVGKTFGGGGGFGKRVLVTFLFSKTEYRQFEDCKPFLVDSFFGKLYLEAILYF